METKLLGGQRGGKIVRAYHPILSARTKRRRFGETHRQQKRDRMAMYREKSDGLTHSLRRAGRRLLRPPQKRWLELGVEQLASYCDVLERRQNAIPK